jgi:hypothetical protein
VSPHPPHSTSYGIRVGRDGPGGRELPRRALRSASAVGTLSGDEGIERWTRRTPRPIGRPSSDTVVTTPSGQAWWVWAAIGVVVLLNASALLMALRDRRHRRGGPGRPPDQRRVRAATILLWLVVILVAAAIGFGVGSLGSS